MLRARVYDTARVIRMTSCGETHALFPGLREDFE